MSKDLDHPRPRNEVRQLADQLSEVVATLGDAYCLALHLATKLAEIKSGTHHQLGAQISRAVNHLNLRHADDLAAIIANWNGPLAKTEVAALLQEYQQRGGLWGNQLAAPRETTPRAERRRRRLRRKTNARPARNLKG